MRNGSKQIISINKKATVFSLKQNQIKTENKIHTHILSKFYIYLHLYNKIESLPKNPS